jgi:hypothetical protein
MIEIRHISEAAIEHNIEHPCRFEQQSCCCSAQASAEDILMRRKRRNLLKDPN